MNNAVRRGDEECSYITAPTSQIRHTFSLLQDRRNLGTLAGAWALAALLNDRLRTSLLTARPKMFRLAIADRISEIPYRLRRPHNAQSLTWSISPEELPNVAIVWPTRYQWPRCAVIVETIKDAFRRRNVLREDATPQTHKGVVMLYCVMGGKTHPVPLDALAPQIPAQHRAAWSDWTSRRFFLEQISNGLASGLR